LGINKLQKLKIKNIVISMKKCLKIGKKSVFEKISIGKQ